VQVSVLGSLEVRAASGEVLEVGGARLRALLIMLALRPDIPLTPITWGRGGGRAAGVHT